MPERLELVNSESPFTRSVQHGAKRQAILSEAARLFNQRGSRATTLQDIADALALTKTSLYYYVKTKEELIYLCYLASCEQHAKRIAAIERRTGSGLEKLRLFFASDFQQWQASRDGRAPHYALLVEIASLKPPHRKDIEQRFVSNFKQLRNMIHLGIEDGSVNPCNATLTALAILGTLAWSPLWLTELDQAASEAAVNEACDILVHGMHPGKRPYLFEPLPLQQDLSASSTFDQRSLTVRKQEAFLKAGTWFFNAKGFKGTSLDEIASHLNVTKGAFYYHIKNKEDLLVKCYERSLRLTESIQDMAQQQGDSGIKKLEICCREIFRLQHSTEGPLIRYNTLLSIPERRRRAILKRTRKTSDQFGDFIVQGMADHSIRPIDKTVAKHLLSGTIMAAMEIPLWRDMDNPQRDAADYLQVFFSGLKKR